MPRTKTSNPQVPGDAPTTDDQVDDATSTEGDADAAKSLDTETPGPVVLTDPDAAELDDAIAKNLGQPPAAESSVTLTVTELQNLVRKAAADAVAEAMVSKKAVVPTRALPTLAEAKATAEDRLAEGGSPSGIETRDGWYVHPMAGATPDAVEQYLARQGKKRTVKPV